MPRARSSKRRRDEHEALGPRDRHKQRLYLILDDYPWGYTIREINMPAPSSSSRQTLRSSSTPTSSAGSEIQTPVHLPRPVICLEAPRGNPIHFSAFGTRILATHRRKGFGGESVPGGFLPIVDVRWRGVTFGPGNVFHDVPVYLPVDAGLFVLATSEVSVLPMGPLWPPRLENRCGGGGAVEEWSWCRLPMPPFDNADVASYAVGPDGQTVLFSTERWAGEGIVFGADATFSFSTAERVWRRRCEWTLPFAGRAHFAPGLKAFVGLSRTRPASATSAPSGRQTSTTPAALLRGSSARRSCCSIMVTRRARAEGPGETTTHVGATLEYMGSGSEFCLVQCVSISIEQDDADHKLEEEEEEQLRRRRRSYLYRLTRFSLSYEDGDGGRGLTTGKTCQVQCYRVPEETTEDFLKGANPVAFWL